MCCSGVELSLNEAEMLAAKAARGAGLDWGVADQIGRSARWLARQHVAWGASLVALLHHPMAPGDSPFLAGAYLADLGGAGTTGPVRAPLWALPPLARPGACVRVGEWEVHFGQAITATCDAASLLALAAATVGLRFGETPPPWPPWPAPASRAWLPRAALDQLNQLAARTYVASSETSRSRGAGAAREDD